VKEITEMMKLSEQDRRIMDALQENCRMSNQELADRVGMSLSACWRRVKALEESGLVARYSAVINAAHAGLNFQAIVHVTLTRHDHRHVDTFIAEVRRRREVLDCYSTTGEADYHLRVLCRDLAAYNRFLEDFLFRLPGIANVRTNLVLKDIKSHSPVPVETE
jgi:DNA-binding Lrp family transcriptional regulator